MNYRRRFALILGVSLLLLIVGFGPAPISVSRAGATGDARQPVFAHSNQRVNDPQPSVTADARLGIGGLPRGVGPTQFKAMQRGALASPISLVASDLDGDGISDLVVGYRSAGGGTLVLWRGLEERSVGGRHLANDVSAFFSESRAFDVPEPSDFLGAGDFDADGHTDLVTSARGGSALYFLGATAPQFGIGPRIELRAGNGTAVGDVNRADGIAM